MWQDYFYQKKKKPNALAIGECIESPAASLNIKGPDLFPIKFAL